LDRRAGEEHFFFFLLNAGIASDELDPFFGICQCRGLEMEVLGWGENAKDMLSFLFWVLKESDCCEV
jgi:hypothetical protein